MALDHLRSTWESLGRDDPLWAVLSDPARRGGRWDLDEFLDTGREHAELITRMVRDAGLSLGDRVLDFGCGVGRLSNALAELGPRVVGVDIAASMIEHARRVVRHPQRIDFVHYDGRALPFPDDHFDSAVSLMVLQHARPVVQLGCLLELQRVVRPGGVLLLQIPSRPRPPQPLHPSAYRARIEPLDPPRTARPGQRLTLRVLVTNDSAHAWPADRRVNLGNHWWVGDEMLVRDDGRAALPEELAPGRSVGLSLRATVPDVDGPVELELDLVQEFVTWWAEVGSGTARTAVTVTADPSPESAPSPDAGEYADAGTLAGADARADAGAFTDAGAFSETGALPDADALSDTGPLPDAGALSDTGRAEAVETAEGVTTRSAATDSGTVATGPTGAAPCDGSRTAGAGDASEDDAGGMEMHGLHTDLVRSLFAHCGCRVVVAEPDHMAGPEWDSFTYLIQV